MCDRWPHLGDELSFFRSVLRWKRDGARQTARLVGVIWFSATLAVTSLRRHKSVCSASRFSTGRSSTAARAACRRSSLGMSGGEVRWMSGLVFHIKYWEKSNNYCQAASCQLFWCCWLVQSLPSPSRNETCRNLSELCILTYVFVCLCMCVHILISYRVNETILKETPQKSMTSITPFSSCFWHLSAFFSFVSNMASWQVSYPPAVGCPCVFALWMNVFLHW